MRSFLRTEGRKGTLVPIDDWRSSFRGRSFIEGSMGLTIGGKPLITKAQLDDIDWLWPFIIDTLEKLASNGYASMYFPGQPIEVAMKRARPDTLSVTVQSASRRRLPRRAAGVEEQNFYAHMLGAGEHFFQRLEELEADGGFQHEFRRLEALRS